MEEKLSYEAFIEKVKEKIHEEFDFPLEMMDFYAAGYTSEDPTELEWIRESNEMYAGATADHLLKDFLLLRKPAVGDVVTLRRISIQDLYEDYERDGFEAALDKFRKVQRDMDASQMDMGRLSLRSKGEYEKLREQLILRPLNYKLHARDLQGHVYKRISDFTLALYQVLGDANHSLTTSKIRRDELELWGMSGEEEKVMQDALESTMRLYPACVYDKRVQKEVDFLKTECSHADISLMGSRVLLSTMPSTNGAVSLFYPGVVEKMMQVMGGAFHAVFMNIKDVMIFELKDTAARQYAKQARASGPMGEMLSGKLYLCDENGVNPAEQFMVYTKR